jgi:drug/metabolite transporter (DMT)-like permease
MFTLYVGELAALTTALLWTLSILAWTSAGKDIGAIGVSFIRLLFASVFLVIYGWATRGLPFPTDANSDVVKYLGLSGFFGLFLADICLFKACLMIGPRLTLLINSLTPPLAAIFSYCWLGEKLTIFHWLGMFITLAGICWVVLEQPDKESHPHSRRTLLWGITLTLFAATGQAIGAVFAKQGLGDYDAMGATFLRVLGALAGYFVLITLTRRWPAIVTAMRNRRAMTIVSFGSFVGPFLGVGLYMVALQHCHVGIAVTLTSMMPVFILPFVIFLYHEKVSLRAAAGAIISVVGIALLFR